MCFNNVTTNAGGIPLLVSTATSIGTETIDIAMGFRRIQPLGYFTLRISDVIPADAIISYYGADWGEDAAYTTGYITRMFVEEVGEPCK